MTRGLLLGVLRHISNETEARRTDRSNADSTSVRVPAARVRVRTAEMLDLRVSPPGSRSSRSSIPPPARRSATSPPARAPEAHDAVGRRARRAAARGRAPPPDARGVAAEGRRAPAARARARAGRAADARGRARRWPARWAASRPASPPFEAYAELGPLDRGAAAARRPRAARAARRGRDPDAVVRPAGRELRRARRGAGGRQRGRAQAVREGAARRRARGRAARPRRRCCSCCTATSAPRGRSPAHPGVDLVIRPGRGGRGQPRGDRRRRRRPGVGGRRRSPRARSRAPASRADRSSACTCTEAVADPFLDALAARARAAEGRPGERRRRPSSGR